MDYVKLHKEVFEWQGESFTKSFDKTSGAPWESYEIGSYALYDKDGTEITSGSLQKSADSKLLTMQISHTITANLLGKYLLLVFLEDSNDSDFKTVIAEYVITYKERKL